MTPVYRFGDRSHGRRGSGDRALEPAGSTYPQFSSYFGRRPEDGGMPSLTAPGPTYESGGSRLTETRDLLSNFAPAAARPSLPNQIILSTNRDSTPYDNDEFFGLPVSGLEPDLPQLFSCPPNIALHRQNIASRLTTIPHATRPLTLANQLRKQNQLLEPPTNRTSHQEEVYGQRQEPHQVRDLDYTQSRLFHLQLPQPQFAPSEAHRQPWPPRSSGHPDVYNSASFPNHGFESSQDSQKNSHAMTIKALESQASSSPTLLESSPAAQAGNRRQYPQQRSKVQETQSARLNGHTTSKPQPARGPPVVKGIKLINPTEAFPSKFQPVFPYEFLNAIQSKCFEAVYHTNDNVVVSAPTGCGKTAILDIAITKLAIDDNQGKSKVVYLAPTKALCKEKAQHWAKSFGRVGMQVSEFTGDTARADMGIVRSARIIVTTFEKWDCITRSLSDHQRILSMVKLVLIDEVHFVKDPRGATLEVIVSRMKKRESKVRLIALSATIPNCEDIADWIGESSANPYDSARLECFGQEFRPVPLEKKVLAFNKNLEDHAFDNYLNSELWKCLEEHTPGKSTLIFCLSRKSCRAAATLLADEWEKRKPNGRLWPGPKHRIPVIDRELQALVRCGVAFHHAGLTPEDKQAVENAFREGQLHIICCTTTLAVGVNTPCHTVVLKGTVGYQDGQLGEYSEMEIMQMLGRAGRPQFEKSALALILTKAKNKARYESLGSGHEVLESTLHRNLVEHLNSEIGLETIRDIEEAKTWMKGTFFYRRLLNNPVHYDIPGGKAHGNRTLDKKALDQKIEQICDTDIASLEETGMVSSSILEDGRYIYRATEIGQAMSKYMIRFNTMKRLLQIPQAAESKDILHHLCEAAAADELKELRWQTSDRECARELSKSSQFLYSIDPTGGIGHKLSLLVQMELAQIDSPSTLTAFDSQRLRGETTRALEVIKRLVRAVIECKASQRDGEGCSTALCLARSLSTKAWEHGPAQLTQVPQVGKALMRKLVGSNIRTVADLANTPASTIERIASRNPPFGKKMTEALAWFPRLTLQTEVKTTRSSSGKKSLDVVATLGFSNTVGTPTWGNKIPVVTLLAHTSKGACALFWRDSLKIFMRGRNTHTLSFSWTPENFEEDMVCEFACEEIAGTLVTKRLAHNLSIDELPTFTRPVEEQPQRTRAQRVCSYLSLDEDISDDDLLVAVQQVPKKRPGKAKEAVNEEDSATRAGVFPTMDSEGNVKVSATKFSFDSQSHNSGSSKKDGSMPQPVRLENSNFKCGHSCSWSNGGRTARGVQCGHQCCREGSKHPPKPNKRSGKRKSEEDDGPVVSTLSGSSGCAKRARTAEPASRSNAHPSTEKYAIDEDGFIDLTQFEEEFSPQGTGQEQNLGDRSNEFDMDMDVDCDALSMLQCPLEVPDACSGDTLLDGTLLDEGDSCWTEFFSLSPSKPSYDNTGGSVTDGRVTKHPKPSAQNVAQPHDSANHKTKFPYQCSQSDQSHRQDLETSAKDVPRPDYTDEIRIDDDGSKARKVSSEPDWVNEFDSSLIEELRGFVDFV